MATVTINAIRDFDAMNRMYMRLVGVVGKKLAYKITVFTSKMGGIA